MRYSSLWLVLATGCAERGRPYTFTSPMLASADVPAEPLPADSPPPREHVIANINLRPAALPGKVLRAPHHDAPISAPLRSPLDLRSRIGNRDARPPIAIALDWSRELGAPVPGATGEDIIAWAKANDRLAAPTEPPQPGDLVVFDRTDSEREADLVAMVIARDGDVIEFAYVGGGVIRRGFADPRRPALRRDGSGASVNTFMRSGRRWPPKGTHYLAGELLAYVVHVR